MLEKCRTWRAQLAVWESDRETELAPAFYSRGPIARGASEERLTADLDRHLLDQGVARFSEGARERLGGPPLVHGAASECIFAGGHARQECGPMDLRQSHGPGARPLRRI